MDESVPNLSILISVYGQVDKLKHCLSCIQKTLSDQIHYEVLIIDDASADGTTHYIESLLPLTGYFLISKTKALRRIIIF